MELVFALIIRLGSKYICVRDLAGSFCVRKREEVVQGRNQTACV